MSRNFLESLELNDSIYAKGTLIAIHGKGRIDSGFVGNFILADFIRRFVPPSSSGDDGKIPKIILVTTQHSQSHWNAVSSKLGWSFTGLKDKGCLSVIDLLEDEFKSQTETEPTNANVLESLLQKISDLSSQSQHEGGLILIEDLSALLYQCKENGEKSIVEFLLKLKSLPNQPILITSVHSSGDSSSEDNEGARMANLVSTIIADVTLQVSPLVTGFSPHISGHLLVKWKQQRNKMLRRFQYKLDDRSVSFTHLAS